jgi:prepilin-type N-terminal cleavage/methylation domain-containing protein
MNTQITNTETSAKKDEKGFTLVELLIVIVILGILSTIVVFSVRGLTGKANTNSCKIDNRSMATALEGYFADKGVFPPANVPLRPSGATPAGTQFTDAMKTGGFMEKVSTKWEYGVNATFTAYTLTPVAPCLTTDAA